MGLFDDVKEMEQEMERFESVQMTELKKRFSSLNEKYQSALNMIQSLCRQVETLKTELSNAENSKREEVNRLERENAETRNAFATVMDELKRSRKQKAAIVRNRDFWKRECEAVGMLYKLETEENEKLKSPTPVSHEKPIPVQGIFDNGELKIAAAIGK